MGKIRTSTLAAEKEGRKMAPSPTKHKDLSDEKSRIMLKRKGPPRSRVRRMADRDKT